METVTNTKHYENIEAIKRHNANSGYYWFSKDTLRFFGSRVLSTIYGRNVFITSEFTNWDKVKRGYTVRSINDNGTINTLSELCEYPTRARAITAARKFAKESN